MNKKFSIILIVIAIISILVVKEYLKERSSNLTRKYKHDSDYYLTSPWVTERIDWYFLSLPEKWTENKKELSRNREKYKEISNEMYMYELYLKDFYLLCMYMDVKEGAYENWNLDKSTVSVINQIIYNLNCEVIQVEKQVPLNNPLEVNYMANSSCEPINYKAKAKGIRFENHILLLSICFNENDSNLEKITDRILLSLESKYEYLPIK